MPTEKERLELLFSDEELHKLDQLRVRLQAPQLRGSPLAVPQRLKLGPFARRLVLERAAEIETALAATAKSRRR